MGGVAEFALQSGLGREALGLPHLHHAFEAGMVLINQLAQFTGLFGACGVAVGLFRLFQLGGQRIDFINRAFHLADIFILQAQQKILLAAPRFQHVPVNILNGGFVRFIHMDQLFIALPRIPQRHHVEPDDDDKKQPHDAEAGPQLRPNPNVKHVLPSLHGNVRHGPWMNIPPGTQHRMIWIYTSFHCRFVLIM